MTRSVNDNPHCKYAYTYADLDFLDAYDFNGRYLPKAAPGKLSLYGLLISIEAERFSDCRHAIHELRSRGSMTTMRSVLAHIAAAAVPPA